jgi:hypothetical protein
MMTNKMLIASLSNILSKAFAEPSLEQLSSKEERFL